MLLIDTKISYYSLIKLSDSFSKIHQNFTINTFVLNRMLHQFLKNQFVFICSICTAICIVVYGYLKNDQLTEISSSLMSIVSYNFGWLYVLSVFGFIVFLIILAFCSYGNIKLGKDEDKPQYNNFTWFSMLFCGATGIGLVFWSIAEPLSHYVAPPQGIQGGSVNAAEFSMRTCFLHWGITQFACFTVVGLGLAYFQFRKGRTSLISNLLEPIIGQKYVNGYIGKFIDVFSVIVTFAGVATSLGLGVSQICVGLDYLFKVPTNNNPIFLIICAITVIFIISAISGVKKGIKYLSTLNTVLALLLLLLAFVIGPKVSILNTLVSSTGQHIEFFFSDVTMMSSFGDNSWIMNWRVFYYAWFIAWCPFVGMFIVHISKGRTVREFILGALIAPTIFTIIWLSEFGTIALSITNQWELNEIARLVSHPEKAVFIVFEQYPLSKILSFLVLALLTLFFVTSADSATFSLSVMTSNGKTQPRKLKKVIWGIIVATIAFLLLKVGSLKPLQTISIAASLPFLFVSVVSNFWICRDNLVGKFFVKLD